MKNVPKRLVVTYVLLFFVLPLTEKNCFILKASGRLLINAHWALCGQWSICENLCLGRAERVAKAAWDRLMAVWWLIMLDQLEEKNESKLCYIGQSILSVMMEWSLWCSGPVDAHTPLYCGHLLHMGPLLTFLLLPCLLPSDQTWAIYHLPEHQIYTSSWLVLYISSVMQ